MLSHGICAINGNEDPVPFIGWLSQKLKTTLSLMNRYGYPNVLRKLCATSETSPVAYRTFVIPFIAFLSWCS